MQYILTEEEMASLSLKSRDARYSQLVLILDMMMQCKRDARLALYDNLAMRLVMAEQSGNEQEVMDENEAMLRHHLAESGRKLDR